MNSLIQQYSREGNTDDVPNGHFYMTKAGMERVATEVVGTHFGWKGQKRDNYVSNKFPVLWATWDVNRDGFITVDRAPTLLRMLLDNVEISDGLQLQTTQEVNAHHSHK